MRSSLVLVVLAACRPAAPASAGLDLERFTIVDLSHPYSATTLYWLEDKSEGHERTWVFLDRQLERVVKLGGKLGQGVNRALSFPDKVVAKAVEIGRKSYGV